MGGHMMIKDRGGHKGYGWTHDKGYGLPSQVGKSVKAFTYNIIVKP